MACQSSSLSLRSLIDDALEKILFGKKLRQRGRRPELSDSEVVTMEIVGEFLGKDCDTDIWRYFKMHWLHFFPKIPDRTNFAKQAANLHVLKRMLQENFASKLGAFADKLHLIDGLPMPVCKFARAHFSQVFKGKASYGYCATKQERYYGFRGHIVVNSIGVVTAGTFTSANVDERDVCPEIMTQLRGLALGDKGYIRPSLQEELASQELYLQTPLRENMKDDRPNWLVRWMMSTRRLVETVIGQLTARFNIEKVRARDMWHQASRFWRKLLAHTVCVRIGLDYGHEPLQFEKLLRC
jgi:hypothetical protein